MRLLRGLVSVSLTLLLFAGTLPQPAYSLTLVPKTEFRLEASETPINDSFGPADSIYIVPIHMDVSTFISDEKWYEGLYYYLSFRLNQSDFLFHYILNSEGVVYEGHQRGEEHRFTMAEDDNAPVIIAYLADTGDLDYSEQAKRALEELVLGIANRNAIPPSRIQSREIEFLARPNEPVLIRTRPLSARWERSATALTKAIEPQYRPQPIRYGFSVASVEAPSEPVNYGDSVVLNLTLKNTGDRTFYQGSDADPIITKVTTGASRFFVNDIWLSTSQAPIAMDNAVLRPGESGTYQVRLGVPLYFGLQTETFQLANSLGEPYPNTQFTVALTVNAPDREVVEITDTETGQLNVRTEPSGFSPVLRRVTPGDRYFVLERNNTGWVKLELGDGQVGWVVRDYTRVVN
ncbi:MAG: Bacterial SH3 domain protein [candidate division WS6 bacterium OLB20]|uniref:Bacterial SH3 domain protein n=1 Tax=candidate division WS6 bacterium OLB20 TaxID=1617426 RepID=A0A136LW13_9BACT|nr:MAG: Bacterial SH3 domain protein [candidate division WS6 bacterium OLB20]